MPKDTFFNLREDKQRRIVDAAVNEIAEHGYDKASVTRIVKNAGIATGSFYQYFEDLDDLFVHTGLEAARIKTAYMQRAIDETQQHDLESCVRAMYLGGLRFGLENEKYFRCAQSILQSKNSALYQKMLSNAAKSELAVWLYRFVSGAIESGELYAGITPELFFNLLTGINVTIIEYLLAAKPDGEMSHEDLETLCELGVHVILHGIRSRND